MRYTYDTYVGRRRIATDSDLAVVIASARALEEDRKRCFATNANAWHIVCTDNLKNSSVTYHTVDSLEEWSEVVARNDQWQDKETREAIRAKLEAKAAGLLDVQNAWKPFASPETDIQMKSAETKPEEKLADRNLKTKAAVGKPTISDVPPIAFFALGAAMADGAGKYGRFNWRATESTVSVFVDAMARHLLGYYLGEDHASDSKVHHLAHLMAGAAILLDSDLHGVLKDDRDKANPQMIEAIMKLIKAA